MIAEFPVFSKLTQEDKHDFDKFNRQFPIYAEWAYGTVLTWWDAFDDLEVARIDNNYLIKSSYLSMGKTKRLVLFGDSNIDQALKKLFRYQQEKGAEQTLYSLPQYTIDALRHPERYIIVDDIDAAEYILSVEMHASLEEHTMYAIRRRIAQFGRATQELDVKVLPLALDSHHNKLQVINALHTWDNIYKNDQERLEGKIIDKALLLAEQIGLKAICLYINGKMHGFVLYKHLPGEAIDINHIKTSYAYEEIFSYLLHALAVHVRAQGIHYMNFEQDLGIEGLRIHKKLLRPVQMLHKYNVHLK